VLSGKISRFLRMSMLQFERTYPNKYHFALELNAPFNLFTTGTHNNS
jgi:hypothetical protein